jgi:D-amino peptidase
MATTVDNVLIIADLEGSSGCWSYRAASFMTDDWSRACLEVTRDVDAVARALFHAGVKHVTIKDFHRTAYNLLPELIDPRARVVSGYKRGPVPGIGNPGAAKAVMFLGMHAASGTEGFLAHTLTSRIIWLEVNRRPLAEVELFAASLAAHGVRPIFFSGCPVACAQARAAIRKIDSHPIDKSAGVGRFDVDSWRSGLASRAVQALYNVTTEPYTPAGPFRAEVTVLANEKTVRKLARRWHFSSDGLRIFLEATDMPQLYGDLIKLCYLTPFTEKILPAALLLNNLRGRIGLNWVRRRQRISVK